ncbi:MAG: hypothetical protein JWQ21_4160 [Herminiimonas sp.]|nr:hypothetical protein [Herminiimonas sp.]
MIKHVDLEHPHSDAGLSVGVKTFIPLHLPRDPIKGRTESL